MGFGKNILKTWNRSSFVLCARKYSSFSPNSEKVNIFDRLTKRRQKDLSATFSLKNQTDCFDYLKDEISQSLVDRLDDISRKFPTTLDLGCHHGSISRLLSSEKVDRLLACDVSNGNLSRVPAQANLDFRISKVCADEEFLPFAENSLDCVLSSLSLHWVNDLPGCFAQIHNALKPDGVFLAALFGVQTLFELRTCLQLAELERQGGFRPHISPFTQARDIGNLLTSAKFSMLTIDTSTLVVNYPSMFHLMHDLQMMGESNAAWTRRSFRKTSLVAASAIYHSLYGNSDGSIPASFDVIYFIGWKSHPDQPKPAPRGSGTKSFLDIKQHP